VGTALKLLLDTSTLLWITSEPTKVSAPARFGLDDPLNTLWVSAASAWEIATKHRSGRLPQGAPLVADWYGALERFAFDHLPITAEHALRGGGYEAEHRDPFDRIIAAQADVERMVLVASDQVFDLFPVQRLW
jgi:PIN domain nuclease of toxin-antitoxin system